MAGIEIRPQHVEKHQFRIGRLPQQEVRQPLLPARPDHQIRIGNANRRQPPLERRLVDLRGRKPPRRHRLGQRPRRPNDLVARAIGQRHGQVQPVIMQRPPLRRRQFRPDIRIKPPAITDEAQPHPLFRQAGDLMPEIMPQQTRQVGDLPRRPPPVLAAEGIQRQPADPLPDRRLDRPPQRLGARLMARHARQAPRRRPSPIAIHDDRDMRRHTINRRRNGRAQADRLDRQQVTGQQFG